MAENADKPSLPPGVEFPPSHEDEKKGGCLKWSLIGCALVSVLLIIGLVWMTMKAKNIIGWALDQLESQVVSAAESSVTDYQKEAFKKAMAGFSQKAREGKADAAEIQRFQKLCLDAVRDGKVTPQEISHLTTAANAAGAKK